MGGLILCLVVPLLALADNHGGGGGDGKKNCSTLGNGTEIAETLNMMPTPLPGNFFMINNFDPMLDYSDHPYADLLRPDETDGLGVRPFFTRIDVLRTPGVTEPLHYLAGDSIWSWQGGCPSTYLVIERGPITDGKSSVISAGWHTIGPKVEDGDMTFSLVIKAGDLYAAFNSDECGTYIGVAIAPGLNPKPEIETPVVSDLKMLFTAEALQQQFADARDGAAMKTVEEWLTAYGKAEAEERRLELEADPEAELKSRALSGPDDKHDDDKRKSCNVLGNTTAIASVLNMGATPLPGNYFSQQNIGITVDKTLHPYPQFLRGEDDTRPFLTHIQVLKTPAVTEPLHYLAGNAIWSFQAGCAISYLVITRVATGTEGKYDVGDVAWNVLGMDVEGGEQTFSIPIGAGDLYTGFNSDECHAFVKTSISPGLNSPPEIETPVVSALKGFFTEAALAKTFKDTRDDVTRSLAEMLEKYGKPDEDPNSDGEDSSADGARHPGVSLPPLALLALFVVAHARA
mmetsp:Transcript_80222/g.186272  ORF Transcript_80222/g.186272 Transcript_80222/m.186272 type:complete len:515 (-) Transcript_80222:164-1708(-)